MVRAMEEDEEFKEEVRALVSRGLRVWEKSSSKVWVLVSR